MMESISVVKRISSITIMSFALFLFSNIIANAQGNVPSGSYKNTCSKIQVLFGIISAQCQKTDGSWKATQLNYKDCEGDISNQNGELKCKHAPKPEKSLPKGSYKQSCQNAYVEGKWLYAKCQKTSGNWSNSSIKYSDCNKDIWNNNGVLTCGGGSSNLPKGSYKETCNNIYVEGNILEADCLNRNGKYSHSSIKYKNCSRGIWNNKGQLECN
jgi:hypothetical protein